MTNIPELSIIWSVGGMSPRKNVSYISDIND